MALTDKQMENILNSDDGKYINYITIDSLYNFTIDCLKQFGSELQIRCANEVIKVVEAMLKKKKQITDNNVQSFVVIIIVAGLLHNLFYKKDNLTTLFEAREKLEPLAHKYNIPSNYTEALFQTIEAQLGEDTPVSNCKPVPNSPTELFSWACWFVHEYNGIYR